MAWIYILFFFFPDLFIKEILHLLFLWYYFPEPVTLLRRPPAQVSALRCHASCLLVVFVVVQNNSGFLLKFWKDLFIKGMHFTIKMSLLIVKSVKKHSSYQLAGKLLNTKAPVSLLNSSPQNKPTEWKKMISSPPTQLTSKFLISSSSLSTYLSYSSEFLWIVIHGCVYRGRDVTPLHHLWQREKHQGWRRNVSSVLD